MNTILRSCVAAIVLVMAAAGGAQTAAFGGVELFYVGGELRDGEFRDAALVHAILPDGEPRGSVVFYPGLGLGSYIWLATPDGREGWAQRFARAGYASYVFDPVDTGPSGLPVKLLQDGTLPTSQLQEWAPESVWSFFGIGSEPGMPYDTAQFPHEEIDQLLASLTTRVGGAPGMGSNPAEVSPSSGTGSANYAALMQLLERTGPATFVIHSFAGRTVYPLGREHPELVEAIVAVETDGCPTDAGNLGGLVSVDYLTLYGDYLDLRAQEGRRDSCQTTADLIEAAGGRAELIELPLMGIEGNSHNLMQDRNSLILADMAIEWLEANSD